VISRTDGTVVLRRRAAGERVVSAGVNSLKPGQTVKLDEDSNERLFNLSEWALKHQSFVWYLMFVALLMGCSRTSTWAVRKTRRSPSRPW
jgi:hypothetical protein